MTSFIYPYPVFGAFKPNYTLSSGSFIYNEHDNSSYLDLFNNFSANPLGYGSIHYQNHEAYLSSVSRIASCAFSYDLIGQFCETLFTINAYQTQYSVFVPAETGALAVTNAINLASLHLRETGRSPSLAVLTNAYHGISGLALAATQLSSPHINRYIQDQCSPFTIQLLDASSYKLLVERASSLVLLVELVRATNGDIIISSFELNMLKNLVKLGAILICDEIQTGFYSSGELWASKKMLLSPDIIVFGKKAQVCGLQAKSYFSPYLDKSRPKYFSATFDFSFYDMMRSISIMRYFKQLGDTRIRSKVKHIESQLHSAFDRAELRAQYHSYGLLSCLTFSESLERNQFHGHLFSKKVLSNKTSANSIRFRPTIDFSDSDLEFLLGAVSSYNS